MLKNNNNSHSQLPETNKYILKKTTLADFKIKYLTIFTIRSIIILLLIVSCGYLLSGLIYPFISAKEFKSFVIAPQAVQQQEQKTVSKKETQLFESYIKESGSRRIFNSPIAAQSNTITSGVNSDLLKDLILVGILEGKNPQAIIEDKKSQKTYYLQKGQFIAEYEITDIQKGRIELINNNQKYELYL